MPNLKNVFAENFKRLRGHTTQEEIARRLGKQRTYVTQIESGKVGFTSDSLEKFARALECAPWELLVPYTEAAREKQPDVSSEIARKVVEQLESKFDVALSTDEMILLEAFRKEGRASRAFALFAVTKDKGYLAAFRELRRVAEALLQALP